MSADDDYNKFIEIWTTLNINFVIDKFVNNCNKSNSDPYYVFVKLYKNLYISYLRCIIDAEHELNVELMDFGKKYKKWIDILFYIKCVSLKKVGYFWDKNEALDLLNCIVDN